MFLWRYRAAKDRVGEWVFSRAQSSRFCSVLYYAYFSPAFHWELFATTRAIGKYRERLESGERCAVLRRNAHRLEKGLLMRPRREVFALDFIEETVEQFARRAEGSYSEEEAAELAWARAVLAEYFEIVGEESVVVRAAKRVFEHACMNFREEPPADPKVTRIPYLRELEGEPPVEYDALYQLALRRRSTRWFHAKPVPREAVEKAVAVATQAPSACNRQPYEFRIFDEPEMVAEVAGLAPGARGFSHNIPAVAVMVGHLDNYFSEGDRHLIYIDSSLAAMGFMYALESLGLSSCPLNWPDSERLERKMAAKLGLERYQRVIMLIAFGYPDETGLVAHSQKKSPAELCRYNELKGGPKS